ncbi:MAG: FG-GAP repeat domain-containing protein, partial [Planctomycetota bacterium]
LALPAGVVAALALARGAPPADAPRQWVDAQFAHLSSVRGDLPPPNAGNQQTAALVVDLDEDGVNDFVIAERTKAPAVVWYRRHAGGWTRGVIEPGPLRIEAGGTFCDLTGDRAPEIVFGGDSGSNEVWWWENPHPNHAPDSPWKRRIIKASGPNKHHDQIFGDFDGDGRPELVFWNQGARKLILAEIPSDPRAHQGEWEMRAIYSYSADGPPQRGSYPSWKGPHEHEGLAAGDIDGDGRIDLVGGGRWFRHEGGGVFTPHEIDRGYVFTRAAVGRFLSGERPQVVLVTGDGRGPLMFYEWKDGRWTAKALLDEVLDGHSLAAVDFDGDGHLDVFAAEMQLGKNPGPRAWILRGDGRGGFQRTEVLRGFGLHESRTADLDGDGRLDILAKPYTWQAPRIDVFLNRGKAPAAAGPSEEPSSGALR